MVCTVIISGVEKNSPAEKAGILAGDLLLRVNGAEICDVLDYRFYMTNHRVTVDLKRDDTEFSVHLVKGDYEDAGLDFDTPLMDKKRRCSNACIFCFIDQNPQGMRDTIYFKDDDSRLSFIHGNYITMTNLSEKDIDRIIKMRISPVRVSVHTTNPELRCRMMKNRHAGETLSYLRRIADSGLEICAQIVLCQGINDGDELERSMRDLESYIPALSSVSVVPTGLTKYRDGLFPLTQFSADEAAAVIAQVSDFAERCYEKYGSRIFYCADEFYLLSGKELPDDGYYGDYSQLENGVGMLRSFECAFYDELNYVKNNETVTPGRRVSVATGAAAYDMISRLSAETEALGVHVDVYKILNDFYGHSITVSGLLTGGDMLAQLRGKPLGDALLIPANAIRADDEDFLDGMKLTELENSLGTEIIKSGEDGALFLRDLLGL